MSHCQLCDAPSVGRTCLKCDPGQLTAKDEVSRLRAEVERLKAQILTLQKEYVRQNPCVDPQDEIDELRREVERLTAERDQARNQFVELAKLLLPAPGEPTTDGDKIVTPLSDSPLLRRMTELMITALKSGPGNFHTVSFQTTKDGQEYSLTIQREGGKTPAQKIAELTAEIKRLEADTNLGRTVRKLDLIGRVTHQLEKFMPDSLLVKHCREVLAAVGVKE